MKFNTQINKKFQTVAFVCLVSAYYVKVAPISGGFHVNSPSRELLLVIIPTPHDCAVTPRSGIRKGIIKEVHVVQVHCKCAALRLMSWNPSDMFYIHVMYIKLNILVTHHTTGIISAQFVLDDDTLLYVVNTDTQYYHLMC